MEDRILKKSQNNQSEYSIRDFNGNIIAEYVIDEGRISLAGFPIYAESRLGIMNIDTILSENMDKRKWNQWRGAKVYELKNQVGDVNILFSDRKINESGILSADIRKSTEYYPFGMIIPGRDSLYSDYRYGFQGMEQDDNFKGKGNSISTEFRQYDPRVARWLSVDPKENKYPSWSNFVGFDDNPIILIDPKGSQTTQSDLFVEVLLINRQDLRALRILADRYNVIIQIGVQGHFSCMSGYSIEGGLYFGPNGEVGFYGTIANTSGFSISGGINFTSAVTLRGFNRDGTSREALISDLSGLGFSADFGADVGLVVSGEGQIGPQFDDHFRSTEEWVEVQGLLFLQQIQFCQQYRIYQHQ